ncbi:hypothetical protein BH09VER1_BH09VER1_26490 [soil metagenome]
MQNCHLKDIRAYFSHDLETRRELVSIFTALVNSTGPVSRELIQTTIHAIRGMMYAHAQQKLTTLMSDMAYNLPIDLEHIIKSGEVILPHGIATEQILLEVKELSHEGILGLYLGCRLLERQKDLACEKVFKIRNLPLIPSDEKEDSVQADLVLL